MTASGQPLISYTYDNDDRLTQITQGSLTVSFSYDAASRVIAQTAPNGVITEYSYDDCSRLAGNLYKKGNTTIGNLTYDYDLAGRRIGVGGSFARTGLPQQVPTATYNASNQQTGFGSQTQTYDLNGNLTSDGTNTYTWNARNQLASITGPGISANFQYDALGKRIGKTLNGLSTAYLYDGANIVQEQVSGSANVDLLTGGVDQFFNRTDSVATTTPLSGAVGSTIALVDATGAVQTQYTYEPFGKAAASGTASSNTAKYTGREDDGTGLYYYRARYYSPSLQRFITEDPIGLRGGTNVYAYVHNHPIASADAFGFDDFDKDIDRSPDPNSIQYIDSQYEQLRSAYDAHPPKSGRSPDFYTVSGSVGAAVGWSAAFIVDRYGNVYSAPGPGYVGVGSPLGLSAMASWINGYPDDHPPSAEIIRDFILAHSFSVGGGALFVATWTYSPGSPGPASSTDFGLGTPQFVVTWTYSLDSPMNDYKGGPTPLGPLMQKR
jgi:RHS repeat-associated protein